MIYRYPNIPAPDAASIFLFGSPGLWIGHALHQLDRSDRAIACDDYTNQVNHPYQNWLWHWMRYAKVRGCWIESGHQWAQFELGLCMGLGEPTVIGTDDQTLGLHLSALLALLGKPTRVHDSIESVCDFLLEFI